MEFSKHIEYNIINNNVAVIKLPQIVVSGDEAMKFSNLVNELLTKNIEKIIIDLQDVNVMNSTGLGMIAGTHNNLSKLNKNLYIINYNDRIEKLFKTTHLNDVLNLYPNFESINLS